MSFPNDSPQSLEWNWRYRDCLKARQSCPEFSIQGRKGWFGRSSLTKKDVCGGHASIIVFFPSPDPSLLSFAEKVNQMPLSSHRESIHMYVTVDSLDQYDSFVKNAPNVRIWADVRGKIASAFGARVPIPKQSPSSSAPKDKYTLHTLPCFFVLLDAKICKSPAMQPLLQSTNFESISSCLQFLDSKHHIWKDIMAEGSWGSDYSDVGIKVTQPHIWHQYATEYPQQCADLGIPCKFMEPSQAAIQTYLSKSASVNAPNAPRKQNLREKLAEKKLNGQGAAAQPKEKREKGSGPAVYGKRRAPQKKTEMDLSKSRTAPSTASNGEEKQPQEEESQEDKAVSPAKFFDSKVKERNAANAQFMADGSLRSRL